MREKVKKILFLITVLLLLFLLNNNIGEANSDNNDEKIITTVEKSENCDKEELSEEEGKKELLQEEYIKNYNVIMSKENEENLKTEKSFSFEVGKRRTIEVSVSTNENDAYWGIQDNNIAQIKSTGKSVIQIGSYYYATMYATIEGISIGQTYLRLYSSSGKILAESVLNVVERKDDLSNYKVENIKDFNYTGFEIKPDVNIKDSFGNRLIKGIDYELSYSNNLYPGDATVTITGIDTYTGTITKKFKIVGINDIDITPYMFNSTYYADMNEDLKKIFGYDEISLKNHYLSYGIKEGRQASPIFNAQFYLNKYSDLKEIYGTKGFENAYYHFVKFGASEGRQGSKYFSSEFYLNNYLDLKKSLAANHSKAIEHFSNSGLKDGMQGSEEFNVKDYYNQMSEFVKNKLGIDYIKYYAYVQGANLIINDPINITNYLFDVDLYYSLYPDLQETFGYNIDALRAHYINYGIKEGRIASYVFDASYYLNKYEDLKKVFLENGYENAYYHFINFGINEGRIASQYFNAKYYIKNNKDLEIVFGDNYSKSLEHFVNFGINEGRVVSEEFNVKVYRDNYKDLQNVYTTNWKQYFKHYILFGKNEKRVCI